MTVPFRRFIAFDPAQLLPPIGTGTGTLQVLPSSEHRQGLFQLEVSMSLPL